MANHKIKKSIAIYKSAIPSICTNPSTCTNSSTCVKRISSIKLLILPSIPTKTLSINKIHIGSALNPTQVQKKQGCPSIKLPLKLVLTPPGFPQNPKSFGMDKDRNDIILSDIYTKSKSQEKEN